MKIINLTVARGHLILWLENGRFVYVDGELTLGQKFYVTGGRTWQWVGQPSPTIQFLRDMKVIAPVSAIEKPRIMAAVNQFNKTHEFQILLD